MSALLSSILFLRPPVINDPLIQMLLNVQRNLQESNDKNARDIKTEIGGLRNKIDESNADMTAKISGLSATINKNAEEFKKEITRIDKRLDDHEAKNKNIIEKAIAEAIAANNAKRDAERNERIERKMANVESSGITDMNNRVMNLEDARSNVHQTPQ